MLAGSVVVAVVVLVAWFPAGALVAQRQTLRETSSSLSQLEAQDRALRTESKKLATPSEIARLARQQFGLVAPGQVAYQVLVPPGTGGGTDPYAGDPGNTALVSPSAAPELPPGSVTPSGQGQEAATSTGQRGSSSSPGLLGRVLRTLEFWR
jgi:hypothetical protein